MSSTDHGLITPENCALLLVDQQPEMFAPLASDVRELLLRNVLILARAARIFSVPVVLTSQRTPAFDGEVVPSLLDVLPGVNPIVRSGLNAWDEEAFVKAVRDTGRRNVLLAGPWTEVSLVFPALEMLEEGFGVYAVEDACLGLSRVGHAAAIRRVEQAGAVSVTALQVLLELQRDWSRGGHSAEVLALLKEHRRAQGSATALTGAAERPQPERRKRRAQT